MNFFLFIFFALLVFVTIGMLVVFYYVRKGIRFFRRMSNGEMTEEEFDLWWSVIMESKKEDTMAKASDTEAAQAVLQAAADFTGYDLTF